MEGDLNAFVKTINGFDTITAAERVDFFALYFSVVERLEFTAINIGKAFSDLRLIPYSNINQYLKDNSNKASKKKRQIKFIKTKLGYHLESRYQKDLESQLVSEEQALIDYSIDGTTISWKPSDIPYTNSSMVKNAEFFSKLYYVLYFLENSIRKFFKQRLHSIFGNTWEATLLTRVDLRRASSIRDEVNLSEMLPNRGENILYYCMWDDYGVIMKDIPSILNNSKENDELVAHLNTIAKIRNAIAHNAFTIPPDYKNELTIFINKYIKIVSKHVNSTVIS